MIKWSLQTIPMKDLKPHRKNPRKISKEQMIHLQELIEKFGLIDKPIINKDQTIIGGHQRVKILKKLKETIVECWVPEKLLSDDDIDHLCIGLNLNQGSFDHDILVSEWKPLDLLKWGFKEDQLIGCEDPIEDVEKQQTNKKLKECPSCGHKF